MALLLRLLLRWRRRRRQQVLLWVRLSLEPSRRWVYPTCEAARCRRAGGGGR